MQETPQDTAEPMKLNRLGQAVAFACLLAGTAGVAHAGATVNLGDQRSVTIGAGLRTSYSSIEDAAPSGTDRSSDFNVDSVRLFITGSLNKYVKAYFNTEKDANDNVKVLDAFGEVQFMPEFNIAMGRTIVPSDRANLSGTYYMPSYEFAGTASQYYSKFASRDDGAVVWGKTFNKKLVYSVGAFNGRNKDVTNTSNQSDSLLFAGRLAFNFLDPEPAPSYFTGSTYYGAADILTVAINGMTQKDGVGNASVRDDYTAYGADLLFEKKFTAGVFTVEGAYSKYSFSTAAAAADVSGGVAPGKGMLGGLAYLFPQVVGWGKFQPFYRYQKFDADAGGDTTRNDFGLNYVINGDNTKINFTYRTVEAPGQSKKDGVLVGLQLMF